MREVIARLRMRIIMMMMMTMIMMMMMACLRMMFRLKHDPKLASRHVDPLADLLVDLHLQKKNMK